MPDPTRGQASTAVSEEDPRLRRDCKSSVTPSHLRSVAARRAGPGLDDFDLHRLAETIADCTEAIRLDPDNPRLYLERAEARASLERYEEAVPGFDRAIGLEPDHAAAYLGRCHAKSELGRHEQAIEDYDHAVHLDPASASVSGDG